MDPEYDEAWIALAETYVVMPDSYASTLVDALPLVREALQRALAINPDSARALAVSGWYKSYLDYDWEGANADFERAVTLAPGYATAHQWYGEILNFQGRVDEALWQLQLARKADPVSVVVRHVPGYILLWALRLEEADVHYQDALDLGGQPLRWTIHNLDILNTLRGNYDEARRRARQLAQMEGHSAAADLEDGVFGKALQYALLGEHELALDNLESAFLAGDTFATALGYMRVYDPIRETPRFQAMLKEINLLP